MTPEISALEQKVTELENKFNQFVYADRYQFQRTVKHSGQKLSFFNQLGIAQWDSGSGRQDVHDNGGAAANIGARFTGNVGTSYYSVGDIVAALKSYGLLKN